MPAFAYVREPPAPDNTMGWMQEAARLAIESTRREVIDLGVKEVSTVVTTGVPWEQIVSAASDAAFDLIVLGTHGRSGLGRFLLGSVAEKVMRHAPCSVLVARGDSLPFHDVLCPIDFSDASRVAMRRAGELATGTVTLAHAVELPSWYSSEPKMVEFLDDLGRRSTQLLETWSKELEPATTARVARRTTFGGAAAQVLAIVEDLPKVDLVVVGSHGVHRALLGSVAERLVRHAGCSVLVARDRR